MKKNKNNIVGIILLIVGAALLFKGFHEYGAFGSKLGRAFGASPTNQVLGMFIGGGICSALGITRILKK